RAFEAAGEVDLAVRLYRRVGEHVEAGELLRRMGEDDAALEEFRRAADRLVASGKGHLSAGRLLADRAGRADLALEYYHAGWELRPRGNALPCLMAALQLHAEAASLGELSVLVEEADPFL